MALKTEPTVAGTRQGFSDCGKWAGGRGGQEEKETPQKDKVACATKSKRHVQANKARSGESVSKDRRILFGGKGKKNLINHNVVYQGDQETGQD